MTHTFSMPSRRMMIRAFVIALAAVLAASLLPAPAAQAAPSRNVCLARTNNTYQKLLECVTADGASRHLNRFQSIADANGDTRASGTPGYRKSANYVSRQLENAGYKVTRQPFDFAFFEENAPAELQILDPAGAVDVPTQTFGYSGSGDVTGTIIAVDLDLGLGNTSTSGCEPEDFDGLDFSGDNDIALMQRGACAFGDKALNAQEAGAEAAIIFNQGNADGRFDIIGGTLGEDVAGVLTIPVVDTAYADGVTLSETEFDVRVFADTLSEVRSTENVIAESRKGDADNVVMAGAHLDSVPEGPGINDNGSGSAGLLETALMMAKVKPVNKVRFAWWGAEESGLVGSTYYVNDLPFYKLDDIALYQNYDMIGSPNYIFMVYDADESTFDAADFGVEVPEGSVAIEDLYERFYSWKGAPYDDTGFSGRSDYQAFIDNGIPSGGLFTGAEEVKTEEQQAIWGGIAGEAFDQCYHQACDTIDNVDEDALALNSDAVAFSMLTYAYSTKDVNGVKGRRVPGKRIRLPKPAGAEGTFQEDPADGGAGPSFNGF